MDWAWRAVADDFHRYLLTRGNSPETARGYPWHTKVFWDWAVAREIDPLRAVGADVEVYLAHQLQTLSGMTAYNRLMALRAFSGFLIATDQRKDDPTAGLKVKKPKRQPVQPFSIKEMQRLLAYCDSMRDRAIILTLADTGVRIGELMGVKAQDINWNNGHLRILGKGRKERWISLGSDAMAALKVVLAGKKSGLVFETRRKTPLTAQQCRKNLCAVAVRAGVARTFPHRFRSTFANYFLESGGDLGALQSVLGHSDITTTSFYAGYTRAQRGLDQMRRLDLGAKLLE